MDDASPRPAPTDSRRAIETWVLLALTTFVVAFLVRLRTEVDDDLWLHLRIGRELRDGRWFGTLPDPLVESADRAYVPTQWLSQVLGSVVVEAAGVTGLRFLRVLALVVIAVAVHLAARTAASHRTAAAVTLGVLPATAAAWAERPQLAGLVLASVAVLLWSRTLADGRPRLAVLPLTWLWSMVHGSWVLGVAFGAVTLVALVVSMPVGRPPWRRLVLLLAVSALAPAATPVGPRLLLEPFAVGSSARETVNEWQQPTLDNPLFVLVVALAALVVLRALRRRPVEVSAVVLAAAGFGLAAYSVRTVAFGALLLAPALGRAFPADGAEHVARRWGVWPALLAVSAVAVTPGVVWRADSSGPLGTDVDAALGALPTGTVVAVDVGVSGWVLYDHPQVRPVRDLRAEIYSVDAARAYESFSRAEEGWQGYATAHGVEAVLAATGSPLDTALDTQTGWSRRAEDPDHVLWAVADVLPSG
ncbi:hypothetical protein JQN72_17165 [Phycicoccus sp. CSK15P-2]|uniref:hypothetical protein n=1 Tax=Phycicoccus sp. CSK15P-2 TaxID=2807627 RepID=UPI001951E489|nr:hypothetical protein [Phycicoccus sp. CSK15P-2]MBM6405975.1 hypothetical protein [Phycicoccus sp. CSK15P-2]